MKKCPFIILCPRRNWENQLYWAALPMEGKSDCDWSNEENPCGQYQVQITKSDLVKGSKLELTFETLTPSRRSLICRLDLNTDSGLRDLSFISRALGMESWKDTRQIHGRPFWVMVSVGVGHRIVGGPKIKIKRRID